MSEFKMFYLDDDESTLNKNTDIEKFFKTHKIIKWQAVKRDYDEYPILLVEYEVIRGELNE